MPTTINLADLFNVSTLSEAVMRLPYAPGLVGNMGLFVDKGISTTSVAIESLNGKLILVPNASRSADPQTLKPNKPSRKFFGTTHLPLGDVILADDLQNLAPFGQTEVTNAQATVINDRLQMLKNSIETTREWQRVGALRGKILDADGSVIYDLFEEFGVQKKSISIDFTKSTTDVRKACLDAKRHAEKKLTGVAFSGFRALCGSDYFDALTGHDSVKAAYANWQAAQDRLGGDMRSGFTFGGIEYIEYNQTVSGQPFIPANVAQMFPVASQGVFTMVNAPANYNETVNTLGQAYYAKAEARAMGKGWDLEVQANPLALCLFPEALVELKIQ